MKEVVDELNSRTIGSITLARKSLIMCRLIPAEDGVQELEPFTPELRSIAQSNMTYFYRQDPSS